MRSALLAIILGLSGCGAAVDLHAVPLAAAGCEQPTTTDELAPEPVMLPGRRCMACHTAGGQASRRAWTAAGTVYDSLTSPCDKGGIDGLTVEIADATNKIILTLTTNRVGNFYTSEDRDFSRLRARVSKDGKMKEMQGFMTSPDCPSCHYPGGAAGGRIYLN